MRLASRRGHDQVLCLHRLRSFCGSVTGHLKQLLGSPENRAGSGRPAAGNSPQSSSAGGLDRPFQASDNLALKRQRDAGGSMVAFADDWRLTAEQASCYLVPARILACYRHVFGDRMPELSIEQMLTALANYDMPDDDLSDFIWD